MTDFSDEALFVTISRQAAEIGRLRQRIAELEDPHYLKGREAKIEQLCRLVGEREADLGRMHGETSAEIERLRLRVKFLEDELKCAEPGPPTPGSPANSPAPRRSGD